MKKLILLIPIGLCCHASAQNMVDRYLSGTPTYTVIANSTNSVDQPRDLDFKPSTNELWIVNRGNSGGGTNVIIYNAGEPGQVAEFRRDSHSGHFMVYPTSIAFGDDWEFATTNEIQNTAGPGSTFMGPTLWSSDTSIFARVFQNNWEFDKPLGSHLDMLHQSPFAMGVAHDSASMFWVFDGHNGNLCKYDFDYDHSPGYDDHSNGKVWRYADIPLTRTPNVPSHMVKDKTGGWLYIVDAGTKKLKRMNTSTGSNTGTLTPPGSGYEQLSGYWSMTGATVEVIDSFLTSQPSGIDAYNGRLIVGDYGNGNIHVYDITGVAPLKLGTIATGQTGMMGVKIGPDGKIWFVNHTQNTVMRIDPGTMPASDAAIAQITAPKVNNFGKGFYQDGFNQCTASITPVVVLRNAGTGTLTSATIQYQVDNGAASNYSWSGSLAAGATASVSLPAVGTAAGDHVLSVGVVSANGTPDTNPANDTKKGGFRTLDPRAGFPFSENFTSASFPPTGWTVLEHNFHNELAHVPSAGNLGNGCVRMDNHSGVEDITGQKDHLISPRIGFATATAAATLRFAVAYVQRNASTNDALKVTVSTDCGATWATVYDKSGAALATAAARTSAFVPTATEWRNESVSLAAYAGQQDVLVQFTTTSGHGNNLYLDDISITNTTGIGGPGKGRYVVFPNPADDHITIEGPASNSMEVTLYDVTGRVVRRSVMDKGASKMTLPVSDLPNGNYILKVSSEGYATQEKITIAR